MISRHFPHYSPMSLAILVAMGIGGLIIIVFQIFELVPPWVVVLFFVVEVCAGALAAFIEARIPGHATTAALLLALTIPLVLTLGVTSLSGLLYGQRETAGETFFLYHAGDYKSLDVAFESFDPDKNTVDVTARVAVDSWAQIGSLQWLNVADGPFFNIDASYPLEKTSETTVSVEYQADFAVQLSGESSDFPFDEYETPLMLAASESRPHLGFELLQPRFLVISWQLDGLTMDVDKGTGTATLDIRLSRPAFDKVLFVLAATLFLLLILMGLIAAFSNVGSAQPLALLLGIVGVGFALPAVRGLIVPLALETRTLFDAYVIIPYLAGSIIVALVVFVRRLLPGPGQPPFIG